MSTNSPDAPDNSGSADSTTAGGKPGGKFIAIAGVVAVALGIGGFFIGKTTNEGNYKKGKSGYEKIYKAGYQAGYSAGESAGTASGTAAGKKAGLAKGEKIGTAQGLQVGKKAGEVIGQKEGEKAGEQAGYAKGFQAGVIKGATAAFGSLGTWNTNVPYIIELDPSPVSGVPFVIHSRTLMQANTSYFLCPNGTTACSSPLLK